MASDSSPPPPPVLPPHGAAILPSPPTLPSSASLETALEVMRLSLLPEGSGAGEEEQGVRSPCVLIVEEGRLCGILTERDAVRWALSDTPASQIRLGSVMSRPVVQRQRHDCLDILATMSLMRRHRIRHLPVVDEQERPTGLVTLTSLNYVLQETFFLRFRQVVEVMTPTVITVRPQDTLRQAIQTMALRSISCVVVTEVLPGPGSQRERPVGILTERDILQLRRLELSIGTTTVAEVMSSPLRCIHPSDDLADVRGQMQRMRVRRMVVTNQAGELVGLITETNLMQSIDPVDLYGVYEIMQRQVQVLSESRLELLNRRRFDLSRALREQEFWLAYQPQLDLGSGTIRSAEALIRWNSPQHGPVPPNDFIPLAEHSGFIVELGQWILTTACQQARQWMDEGKQPIRMAVNVTAHQLLAPRFVSQVMATLEQTGLPPEQLTLELTESVLVENTSATAECFQELQREGVRISIDDFGTGYASLSYLQHFHFNELKIDRSFVSHIDTNHRGQVIVRSVLDLARTMGFTTVAEGVETAQELEWLRQAGCAVIQGYLVSRPIPAHHWEPAWLNGNRQTATPAPPEGPTPEAPG
ncbi:MAG: EAL domain-containing protein [Synechococcus sp.]|nr:EAL domain-containing protein [Synechococcus sp.]